MSVKVLEVLLRKGTVREEEGEVLVLGPLYRRLQSVTVVVALSALVGLAATMPGEITLSAMAQGEPTFVPGEILLKLHPSLPTTAMAGLYNRIQVKPLERLNKSGWIRVKLRAGQDVQHILPTLRQFPQITMAEPNYIVRANGIPNDPAFAKQWGLHNMGQAGGTAGVDIDAPEAWDNFVPAGNAVVVAVIDTGVDYQHTDLAGRMWTNPNEVAGNKIDDDRNGYVDDVRGWDFANNDSDPMDDNNHGTHVAGTLAAAFNNSAGVAGVAGPANVKIMPLKFLGSNGTGLTSNAIKALDYATSKGAVISNNSWGGSSYSQALADAIARNHAAGRLVVAAAGNEGRNTDDKPYYPQGYNVPNVISVASMTASDTLSSFSNYGAQSVDLAAPGSSIYSTVKGGRYATYNGTSMATPHVAGAAALIWAKNPMLTNVQVRQIILDTTRKAGYVSGKTVTGGVLNLKGAMLATTSPGASPSPSPQPTPQPTPAPNVPAAPSSLAAKPVLSGNKYYASRQVKLSWKDNATNESRYEVYQSTSATANFKRIASLGANVVTWTHYLGSSPLKADYYYKVRALNSNGASGYSNVVKVNKF